MTWFGRRGGYNFYPYLLRDPFEQLQVTYYDPATLDKRPTQVARAVTDSEVGAVSSSICREQGRGYSLATVH